MPAVRRQGVAAGAVTTWHEDRARPGRAPRRIKGRPGFPDLPQVHRAVGGWGGGTCTYPPGRSGPGVRTCPRLVTCHRNLFPEGLFPEGRPRGQMATFRLPCSNRNCRPKRGKDRCTLLTEHWRCQGCQRRRPKVSWKKNITMNKPKELSMSFSGNWRCGCGVQTERGRHASREPVGWVLYTTLCTLASHRSLLRLFSLTRPLHNKCARGAVFSALSHSTVQEATAGPSRMGLARPVPSGRAAVGPARPPGVSAPRALRFHTTSDLLHHMRPNRNNHKSQ